MIVSFLFSINSVSGQEDGNFLFFDHFTISDGLSHNTVHCLLQDHHGYFWIGTQYGLNKYDGYSCAVVFSVEERNGEEGLSGKKITALMEDKDGNLWVGTGKGGMYYKSAGTDHFMCLNEDSLFADLVGFEITSIYEDRAKHIWVTTIGNGVFELDRATAERWHYREEKNGLSNNLVFDIVEDQYNTIWVAAAGGGLNILGKDRRFELSHEMLPNSWNLSGYRKKLYLDGNDLWVGTEGTGLYRVDIRDKSYEHFSVETEGNALSSNVVRDIVKAADGRIFIATDGGGLNVYDLSTGQIHVYSYKEADKEGLNSKALYCFFKDRTENIWIGTYNGGVNIYKPDKVWFKQYAPGFGDSKTLTQRSILSLLQSENGTIWVGTDGGGLNRVNAENTRFLETAYTHGQSVAGSSISGNIVKTMYEDSRGKLWLGLFGEGLDRYDPQAGKFTNILGPSYNVWSISQRLNGDLWIGTMGGGVVVIDTVGKIKHYYQTEDIEAGGLSDLNVMVVYVDRDDNVWIGTADQGLDRWNKERGLFEHFRHVTTKENSLSNDEIRSIFQDSRGDIWIGTEGGGLNRWMGEGRFERIGVEEGLVGSSVMGIAEDIEGQLWISTFEGVSRFHVGNRTFRNFDFRIPEYANQFNQSALLASSNGKVFLGGINGLHTIDISILNQSEKVAPVIFTNFKVLNQQVTSGPNEAGRVILDKPIEEAEAIHLNYLDKTFSIEFALVDFTNSSGIRYRYKMEGFDDRWQETEVGQNEVSYTNLDPGNYFFKVGYRNQTAEIAINISPPFWQTMWFRFVVFLSSIGLIVMGMYVFINRREANHRRQVLQLQNDKLAAEVESASSKLMYSAVQMAHKNEILTGLKEDLILIKKENGRGIEEMEKKINVELQNEDQWKEFDIYFNQVNQYFYQSLIERHPGLTSNDLRLCSLIRINLSTKEIAFLLNISVRAVEQGRYRLKKRLDLEKEEDLNKYIAGFSLG